MENSMTAENKKKYELPEITYIELCKLDVIRTSEGLDMPMEDDHLGEWEI
jgi:hypothetical protein